MADLQWLDSKTCGRCQVSKPLEEFPRNRSKRDGRGAACKWCDADRMRAFRDRLRKHRKKSWMGRKPGVRAGSQRCYLCNTEKPLREFHRDRNRKTGHSVYCKECANEKSKEWRLKYPDRAKDVNKRKFGLKPGDYAAMSAAQNGLCACCGDLPGQKGLQVDHCHRTGRVRALLCASCNLGLGTFKDDPERLRKAIAYLTTGGEH